MVASKIKCIRSEKSVGSIISALFLPILQKIVVFGSAYKKPRLIHLSFDRLTSVLMAYSIVSGYVFDKKKLKKMH